MSETGRDSAVESRREYSHPELEVYGDLSSLTRGSGGTLVDADSFETECNPAFDRCD